MMKKFVATIFAMLICVTTMAGCTEADRVSRNVGKEADNFNVSRRLTVLNARTDKPMFELIGNFSYQVNDEKQRLEIVVETGPNEYKKHFVGLNEWTMYVIEDLSGAEVSKYRYEVSFLPEAIVPVEFTTDNETVEPED